MGYHSLSCFNQTFQVSEKYELAKEIGQGAYGIVWYESNSLIERELHIFLTNEIVLQSIREMERNVLLKRYVLFHV